MTAAPTGATGGQCPVCRGELIDGRVAIPIVGSLRFVYQLGSTEVATEVLAQMCKDCGHVALRARNPDLVSRAQQASRQARPAQRWTLRAHRSAGEYRSRYGQEQAQ